jgi:hypothetical protein
MSGSAFSVNAAMGVTTSRIAPRQCASTAMFSVIVMTQSEFFACSRERSRAFPATFGFAVGSPKSNPQSERDHSRSTMNRLDLANFVEKVGAHFSER